MIRRLLARLRGLFLRRPQAAGEVVLGVPGPDLLRPLGTGFVPPALPPAPAMHAATARPLSAGGMVFLPACGAEDWSLLSVEMSRVTCGDCRRAVRLSELSRKVHLR